MRRRHFLGVLGTTAMVWPLMADARQPGRTPHVDALQQAKRDYERISHPSEQDRSDYLSRLVRMREKAARSKTQDWQLIDAEIRRHPAPPKLDSNLLVGKWRSPRHDYLFQGDGTWMMLPAEVDGVPSTHGSWRIEGNQFFYTAAVEPSEASPYTIILITKKDLVYLDQTFIFYETRLK